MFPTLDLCLGTGGIALALGRVAVTIDDLLLASQKIGRHADVMLVDSCYFQRVHKPALVVNAYMCLVAKVRCASLLGRMGIRIPFFLLVPGWGW